MGNCAVQALVAVAPGRRRVQVALVSLVDENRQWFKSCIGTDVRETPRAISFCGHAINKSEPLVVPDALRDNRVALRPIVPGEPILASKVSGKDGRAKHHVDARDCTKRQDQK